MTRRILPVIFASHLFACLFAWCAYAGGSRLLSPNDIVSMRGLQNIAISPNGSAVAYVVNEPLPVEQFKSPANTEIWVADGSGEKRYTNNPGTDTGPQWSPDGSTIAFLSHRGKDEGNQLYMIGAQGGDARRLTQHGTSITSFAWSPDGRRIAFISTVPPTAEEKRRTELGEDESVLTFSDVVHRPEPQKLWIVDKESGSTELVRTGAPNTDVVAFKWAPDGSRFALLIADAASMDDENIGLRLAIVPAGGGDATTYCHTAGKLSSPQWRPDGNALSFLGASAGGREPAASSLYLCQGLNSAPLNLTEKMPFTVSGYTWLPQGKELLVTITEKESRYLARFDPATRKLSRLSQPGDVVSASVSVSSDASRIALGIEGPHAPADVWMGPPAGPLKRLTRLNPGLEDIKYGDAEDISWRASDGLEITGVLIKPVDYRAGEKYPLLTLPHGGPESADLNGFQVAWGQFFAAHGYAVLLPNFRGGIGRGVEFTLMDNTDFGGKDFQDILAGVDELIHRGIADPERLGIGGWSYGGFMTAWAVTQTNRFKAAMMGAGVSDWFALMGQTPEPHWTEQVHFEAWPWDDPHAFRKNSPIEFVKQVRTPVLILHGENDNMVAVAQARDFYRALQHYKVPSEFVVYPREGHGMHETAHRLDVYDRMLKWFDHYLK
jgi:dipeptidyl aminopeptidase/acylaminoacyl peptidase